MSLSWLELSAGKHLCLVEDMIPQIVHANFEQRNMLGIGDITEASIQDGTADRIPFLLWVLRAEIERVP
jgi:hypothetical protein